MISALWELIAQHIERIDRAMPAVHHYTSLEGALGILSSGRLWFTERAHLNDPSEISHGVEIARRILFEQRRQSDAIRIGCVAARVFENFRFFSASFSFLFDDRCQWRHYADKGRGVVLSFKASAFDKPKAYIDSLIEGNPTAVVCPMSYERADLEAVLTQMVERWDGKDVGELCDHIFMISSMFKSGDWKSECEYRFFVHDRHNTIVRSKFYKIRRQNDGCVSYLDLPVKNWEHESEFPICRVCVGPAASCATESRLRDRVASLNLPIQDISRSELLWS